MVALAKILPCQYATFHKKVEVFIDWTSHMFFRRDVAMIKRFVWDRPKISKKRDNGNINQDKFINNT